MRTHFFSIYLGALLFYLSGCATVSQATSCKPQPLPFSESDLSVDAVIYGEASSKKSLIIMPPTGGVTILDRGFAKQFCKAGYAVYVVETWSGLNEKSSDLELHQRLYERSSKVIKMITNHIEVQAPGSFIGILGTSVGALHAAVSASINDRLDAVFSIVGGVPIAKVVITSDQKAMQLLKKERYQRYGFKNDDEYLLALEKAFPLEPTTAGSFFKGKSLGVLIAENDTTVPTASQNQLQEFWQPTTVIRVDSSHFWGIIKARLFYSDEILHFFETAASKKWAASI